MRLAVISDIHGNMEAFTAVLSDMERSGVDEVVCLGDAIGYGPQPCEVIATLLKRRIPSVLGNHEMAARDPSRMVFFNPYARISIKKTISLLTDEAKMAIDGMPPYLSDRGCRFVHGFPPESTDIYLFHVTGKALAAAFSTFTEDICFVGHTHYIEIIEFDGVHVTRNELKEGTRPLDKQIRHIVNIGSVGQPRDGSSAAKYAIFDTSAHTLDIRFVPYDIAGVVRKLITGGWPEIHALRLW